MKKLAIIGRPNVGKSTIFNRLSGRKIALVDPTPGLTRDRREGIGRISDLKFMMIDTAGIEDEEASDFSSQMLKQTKIAIRDADILMLVLDGRAGFSIEDREVVDLARRSSKDVILVVNKCENLETARNGINEAYTLGIGDPVAMSAEHGLGIDQLYQALAKYIEPEQDEDEEREKSKGILHIAIAGRPNAGKSTLFNSLLGEDRAITSPISGTTRDAVYIDWEWEGQKIRLVDTAGLRKKAKIESNLEKISVDSSLYAIRFADLVILCIDSTLGIDKQDQLIADHVLENGRALLIAANKWDLIKTKGDALEELRYKVEKGMAQARGVKIIPISASKGKGIKELMNEAMEINKKWNQRVSTGKLNRWLQTALDTHLPPLSGGRRINFKYITQVKSRPPSFALFTSSNLKELPDSYLQYLVGSMREAFDFGGIPMRMMVRKSHNPFENKKK